jgi:hypothetical protein
MLYLCRNDLRMAEKQVQILEETTFPIPNNLHLYNISTTDIHYTLHNLFRGLKFIRRKYNLTINEIIFLNAMYLYCKHVSTCMSQDACLRFIGYYNLNKVKYYIGSLRGKGMIEVAEIIHGYKRYKLTIQGISAVNDLDASFERCLAEWFQKNGISLYG